MMTTHAPSRRRDVTDHPTLINVKNSVEAEARIAEVFGADNNIPTEVYPNGTVLRVPIEYVVGHDWDIDHPDEHWLEVEPATNPQTGKREDHLWKVVTDVDSYYYVWWEQDKLTAEQIERINARSTS